MNTLVLDSFASFGVAIRPLLIATALFGLWRGLRRTALPRRTQLGTWLIIAIPLVLWFVLILELALAGFFVARPGGRVPRIPLAVVIPLVTGLLLMMRSTRMAAVADATPLSWLIGFQVFRALGSVFLFQWAAGRWGRPGRPPGVARRLLPRLRASRRPRGRVRVELARDPGPGGRPHTRLSVLADALPAPGPRRAEPPRGCLPARDDPGLRGAAGPHSPRAFPLAASPLRTAGRLRGAGEGHGENGAVTEAQVRIVTDRTNAHPRRLGRGRAHA